MKKLIIALLKKKIVILKFGEIEKEINATFLVFSSSESPRQLQHTAAVSNNSSIGSFILTTPLSCVR